MKKFMNRIAIVSLAAMPIAAMTAIVPAGASGGGTHFRVVAIHSLVSPSIPNSNIVGVGKKATYVPNHLKYKAEPTPCSAPFSFSITNTGSKTANVYVDGSPFAAIAANSVADICGNTPKGEVDTFGLGNAAGTKTYAATLTVTSKG